MGLTYSLYSQLEFTLHRRFALGVLQNIKYEYREELCAGSGASYNFSDV